MRPPNDASVQPNAPTLDPPCEDKAMHCELWASRGECEQNPSYMRGVCPKTCNNCQSEQAQESACMQCTDEPSDEMLETGEACFSSIKNFRTGRGDVQDTLVVQHDVNHRYGAEVLEIQSKLCARACLRLYERTHLAPSRDSVQQRTMTSGRGERECPSRRSPRVPLAPFAIDRTTLVYLYHRTKASGHCRG